MARDLSQAIAAAANGGQGRVSIGPAPTWGGLPVPRLFPSLVAQATAGAISFYVTEVSATGTPAALVPRGGAKPAGATVATVSKTIGKFSALATLELEDFEQSEAAISQVTGTLFAQCAVAQDFEANNALNAASVDPVAGTSWVSVISAGQAAVAAAGGSPNLVVVPASMWADLASEIATSPGLVTPSGDVLLDVLGSRVIISPTGTGAYVVDPNACTTVLRDAGIIVDSTSLADTNTIRVVVDLVAATFVTRPSGVAAISVTAA